MFTGIVEGMGIVEDVTYRDQVAVMDVRVDTVLHGLAVGHSVSVNGTCLTAVAVRAEGFTVEMVAETLRRTNLGQVGPGSRVNLECSLTPTAAVGGHFVQGHIDGTGTVLQLEHEGESVMATFQAPPAVEPYLVPKGFVAVDGVSLTVVDLEDGTFRAAYIPHTLAVTVAGGYRVGDTVNLEADVLAKYVRRLVAPYERLEVAR